MSLIKKNSAVIFVFVFVCIAFLCTQHFFLDIEQLRAIGFVDYFNYKRIFTSFVNTNLDIRIDDHHAYRFMPFFLASLFEWEDLLTWIVLFLFSLLCLISLYALLRSDHQLALPLFIFLLFPYSFRIFLISPYSFADAGFFFCSVLFFVFYNRDNYFGSRFFGFLSLFFRQTGILFVFVELYFLWIGRLQNRTFMNVIAYVMISLVLFFTIGYLADIYFPNSLRTFQNHLFSVESFLHGMFSPEALTFWSRVTFFIAIVFFCLEILGIRLNRTGIIAFAVISLQPFVTSWDITGGNVIRLLTLGLPLLFLKCNVYPVGQTRLAIGIFCLLVLSFHHNYTVIGMRELWVAFCIVGFFAATWLGYKRIRLSAL